MLIVDSQIHLWRSGRASAASANPNQRKDEIFGRDEILAEMATANVSRAVIVPPSWETNDFALELAREMPDTFAVSGRPDLEASDAADRIAHWRDQPGMLGIRLAVHPEHASQLSERRLDGVWSVAEGAGVPVTIWAPGSLNWIADIAERFPGMKLTLDHLGIGRNARGPGAFDHIPELVRLAKFANVAVKASGLPAHSSQSYPFRDIDPHIHRIFDAFGPRRLFWGTDLTRMPVSYRQCVTQFTEELPWLGAADQEWVMGRGFCDWTGWKFPAV